MEKDTFLFVQNDTNKISTSALNNLIYLYIDNIMEHEKSKDEKLQKVVNSSTKPERCVKTMLLDIGYYKLLKIIEYFF